MKFLLGLLGAPSRSNSQRKIFMGAMALTTVCAISWSLIHAAPPGDLPNAKQGVSPVLDFRKSFPSSDVRFLGFADQRTALLIAEQQDAQNKGEIIRWDTIKSQKVGVLALSNWISAFSLRLSPDGKYLAATNDPSSLEFKHAKVYRVTVLNSSNLKTVATHEISESEYCSGVIFSPSETGKVILKMRSRIPYEDTFIAGKGYLEIFDISSQKIVRSIPYHPSYEADRIVSSPDGKLWLMLYYSFFFNNFGEAGTEEEQDKGGTVDVINPTTGKIEWHIASSTNLSVGDPLFFISPQEFVSSASIFNRTSRTSRSWPVAELNPSPSSPISEIPGKPQFVVLGTKTGIKIRNWVQGEDIKLWELKGITGRCFFSPDLTTIAYKQGKEISFLNFDPKLLN